MKTPVSAALAVLHIRLKQMYRIALQIGLVRTLILLIPYAALPAAVYSAPAKEANACYAAGIWAAVLCFIHAGRTDRQFMQIHLDFPQWICGAEYAVLSLPLIACLLMRTWWLPALSLLTAAFAAGFIKPRERRQPGRANLHMQAYLPYDAYEWKAGIRKYLPAIATAWLAGLSLSFLTPVTPVAAGITGLLAVEFYNRNESWQMLVSCRKSAGRFLWHKTVQHLLLFTALILPLIVVFLLFHPGVWYIILIEYAVILSIHVYAIALKYAFYSHNRRTVNYALLSIGVLAGAIPLTTPLLWIFTACLFYRANTNLNFYLNDYH
jgi:hypothetical protein